MTPAVRISLSLFLIVPLGFLVKSHGGAFGREYGAAILYEIFWVLLLGLATQWRSASCGLFVFLGTCVLELAQLWHPAWLDSARATALGRMLFGSAFDARDFAAYAAGCFVGAWLLSRLRR